MAGKRPELKISAKPVDGGREDRVDLFAFWRRDNGRLSGDMDRKVRGVRVYLDGGGTVTIKRGDDGRLTHYLDCWEEEETASRVQYERGGGGREDFPPDDFGEIPF